MTQRPTLVYSQRQDRRLAPDLEDRQLLAAMTEGAEWALDELIRRKTQPLLQVAFRILGDREDAWDVVQLAFLKVWQNRHKFSDRWSPNTWIYRIATNLAIDSLRSRRSREKLHEPVRLQLQKREAEQAARPARELRAREVETLFRRLAAELTEKQRAVFVLRELEGLSSKEVASITNCRESTVRNHLFNARRTLRHALARDYPEYARLGSALGDDRCDD